MSQSPANISSANQRNLASRHNVILSTGLKLFKSCARFSTAYK